jgi:Protein of unknown function (DUF2934)
MWFVQQFDSFLNLGICKEYPKMARSKSTSGGKANRTTPNNEQTSTSSPANIPDVKVAGTTPAEAAAGVKIAPEPKSVSEPRKLEMVKTEPRKKVVPINRAPVNLPINLEDEIRRRAYELYLQRGTAPGSEAEDWLTAEREVRQRYQKQQSA